LPQLVANDGQVVDTPPAIEIVPAFFGLLGVGGVLPSFYTELLARREMYEKDTAARAFLDIFQQRAVTLFYEAWRKHRLPPRHEEDRRKHFLPQVLALAGLGQSSLRDKLRNEHGEVRDDSIAFFAATFQQRTRSAAQVEGVLADYFGVEVRIDQFVGRWYAVPSDAQAEIGRGAALGHNALVGERVWQRDMRMRLSLGPLDHTQFNDFLPQGRSAGALRELLTLLSGVTLEYEVRLLLRPDHAPEMVLGGSAASSPRLGWDSWLHGTTPDHALNDACYDIHAAAA